jgi:FkbM family methyltransferase
MAQRKFAEIDVQLLQLLKKHRFEFNVVYDVGSSNGSWSWHASKVFPEADFHLFEPLVGIQESYSEHLKRVLQDSPKFTVHPIALGDVSSADASFFVTDDGFSSTTLNLAKVAGFSRKSVPMHRLDDYVRDKGLPLPDFIKMDVQGGELRILSAAEKCLQHASALLLETWLYKGYGPGTPLLGEILTYVNGFGFDLVEIGDRYYDETHKLVSVDALVLKHDDLVERKGTLPLGDWVER